MAFCWLCNFVAFAKALDQFSEIEFYSGTAVGWHLQKFWISFAESNIIMALERRFGRPDRKSTMEQYLEQPRGIKLALERHCWQRACAKLALERRSGRLAGAKLALDRRFGRPGCKNTSAAPRTLT